MLQWLSINRLGFKDAIQISGDPLNPLEVQMNVDLNRLSVDELKQMEQLMAKAEVPASEQIIDNQIDQPQVLLPAPVVPVKLNGRANGRTK
jgi:hypothetical protein